MNADETARRLRMARAYAGAAATDVARKMDVSRGTVANWESGRLPRDSQRRREIIKCYLDISGLDPTILGFQDAT